MKLASLLVLSLLAMGCAAQSEPVEAPVVMGEIAPLPARIAPVNVWRVVVDPSVSPEREAILRASLEDWTGSVRCPFTYTIEHAPVDLYPLFQPVPPETQQPSAGTILVRMYEKLPRAENGLPAIGMTESYQKDWQPMGSRIGFLDIPMSTHDYDFGRVARHELGHAFKLAHDDAHPGVMMSAGRVCRVTPTDAEAFERVWCPAP